MTLRYTFRTKPYSHQLRALAKIAKLNGVCGLWMPMRTGKTKTVIDWAGIAYHNHGLRRVLVITPATVMSVWRDEIALHCPVPSHVTLLSGALTRRAQQINDARNMPPAEGIDWLIINYEAVWRAYAKGHKLDDLLRSWAPDLVVADESHKLKNPTTRQSKAVSKIAQSARMRLALTGTPVTKSPLDLFGQLRFLDPGILTRPDGSNQTWTWFKQHYGVWGGYAGYELVGYRHLDELTGLVKAHSFKVLLEECFDLPEKEFITVPVELSPDGKRMYRQMAKEMMVELEGSVATADIVLTKLLRLSQITSGFLKDTEGNIVQVDHAKLDACLELVEKMIEADEKVVIFARFKRDCAQLLHEMERRGFGPVVLAGDVPQSQREGLIRRFQTDPECKVFIAQTAAGSLGIDLTAARFAIFYSLDYRWDTYVQAIERIGGPKQTRPMTVYHLVVPGSIDQIMLDVLKVRGNLAKAIIHDPRLLLGDLDAAA